MGGSIDVNEVFKGALIGAFVGAISPKIRAIPDPNYWPSGVRHAITQDLTFDEWFALQRLEGKDG
jgi:hypothetical protein